MRSLESFYAGTGRSGAPFSLISVGSTFLTDARFEAVDFQRDVTFLETTFLGQSYFNGATFAGEVNFERSAFHGFAHFKSARFNASSMWFDNVTFRGGFNFNRAIFSPDSSLDLRLTWDEMSEHQPPAMFEDVTFGEDMSVALGGGQFRFSRPKFASIVTLYCSDPTSRITLYKPQLSGPTTVKLVGVRLEIDEMVLAEPLTIDSLDDTSWLHSIVNSILRAPLILDGDLSLTEASLMRSTGLAEHLRLVSEPKWRKWHRRRILPDELHARRRSNDAQRLFPSQVESLYRQLRAGLEASKASPAAADFYYGELEMRRLAVSRLTAERYLLWLYKWLGGYGVRAWRPIAAYVVLLATSTYVVQRWTDQLTYVRPKVVGGLPIDTAGPAAAFVARNSISLFSAPADGLSGSGTLLMVGERFASVTLLTLAVLAIRSKVQR